VQFEEGVATDRDIVERGEQMASPAQPLPDRYRRVV
jgi:hypothetical protein